MEETEDINPIQPHLLLTHLAFSYVGAEDANLPLALC